MDLLSPPVGAIIDYTYGQHDGWIEVLTVGPHKIIFNDNYKHLLDHKISFHWSTWKIHLESTLEDVRFRTLKHSTWEV